MTVAHALRHGWLVIVLAALAGGAGGGLSLHQQTRVYRSSVDLLVAVGGATTPADDARNRSLAVTGAFGLAQIALTRPALADAQARAGTRSDAAVAVAAADLSDPFLRIEVTDPDPATAQAVAAAFVTTLPRTAAALGVAAPRASLVVLAPAGRAELAAPLAWRYLLAGIAAGLGAGLALSLLREILGTRVADAEQTAAIAGWPLLAVVPAAPRRARAGAAPDSPRAEACRQVLTAALHATAHGVRTVAVVDAGPGDGATGLTANLLALARGAGHDVVAVDDATTGEWLRRVRTHGPQELVLVDAGRTLPHPSRPELLSAADVVVVVVAWRHRHRAPAAARALRRLDATVVGLVVDRGPRGAGAESRHRGRGGRRPGPTTVVPLPRPPEKFLSEMPT